MDIACCFEFSGAATYSYPIEVPPGRGGLQPELCPFLQQSQFGWGDSVCSQGNVASGWSIGDSYIIREGGGLGGKRYTHMVILHFKHKDNYRLVLKPVGYELIAEGSPSNPDSMRYYAKKYAQFKGIATLLSDWQFQPSTQ
ncbi:MAG: hypothetical protein IPL28_20140 [Chloroflexi bacterium]|nr:hypothetical protein [Chloroflexota bacterium]